ncbi:glycerol kinase GlpK [Rhodobacter sp. KR11]|uniref:glycerol kinase GlpK n=1 Tax=Rhodobacter sp. KR11 TaxID=2974588 RepID=UPI002221E0F3|nr:glycerol kinase GlpK [Rhodobacter sp. KR11]MCW1920521.1 glycerol kinase GlpK [Rhodobacter sp. KR11]
MILAIDQGTTSSRAILFDGALRVLSQASEPVPQHFPAPAWVEHDPADLWATALRSARKALDGRVPDAIGITNQRETTLLWDRKTGAPLHRALVWQDRRTVDLCDRLRPYEALITARTGLVLDPYFSATKLAWLLDHIPGARARARAGELAFGTVDSWLIWQMTGGHIHATDATNAARTMLYDIDQGAWDADICGLLDIPMSLLPQVRDSAADYGMTRPDLFGRPVPILGVAGDQQAAAVGQGCFSPGMLKATYGTGCFALLNTGSQRVTSQNRLLTTIACQLDGKPTYALEGSIFMAGATLQWLSDGLRLIGSVNETSLLAAQADPEQDITLVPAFTGLGAPWWRPDCRGAIFGLTRATSGAEIARAALEAVGFQTADLLEAMRADGGAPGVVRVDGGMSASDAAMQFLADILNMPVERPALRETTAKGAAYLAGLQAGICPRPETFQDSWSCERRFDPGMEAPRRAAKRDRWARAVTATMMGTESR